MTMDNDKRKPSVEDTKVATTGGSFAPDNQTVSDNKSGFQMESLSQFGSLSKDSVANLESELAQEFKQAGRQYVQARLARIHKLVEKVDHSLSITRANEKNWEKVSSFEIGTINNIKYNFENLILQSNGSSENKSDVIRSYKEYESESKEIVKNLQSPLAWDETLRDDAEELSNNKIKNSEDESKRLIFPYYFQEVFEPFKKNLQTIVNEKNYQTDLIYKSSVGNSTIIWRQYYNNLVRKKQLLVDETSKELFELYKEFHQINENEMASSNWKQYYKSVISINDLKRGFEEDYPPSSGGSSSTYASSSSVQSQGSYKFARKQLLQQSHDSNYVNPDNQYLQNNRVESSNIRRGILKRMHDFDNAQNSNADGGKRIRLNVLSGLSTDEIDSDLLALRSRITRQGRASEIQQYGQGMQEDYLDSGAESDDVDMEEEYFNRKDEYDSYDSGDEYDIVHRYVEKPGDLVGLDIVEDYDSYDGSSSDEDDFLIDEDANSLDSDGNEVSDSEDEGSEQKDLKSKYKLILGFKGNPDARARLPPSLQSTLTYNFEYPALPPLEKFPKLV